MKRFLISAVGCLLAKYDAVLGNRLAIIRQRVNSIRKSRGFKKIGKNVIIRKDAKIINPKWIMAGDNLVVGDRVTLSAYPLGEEVGNEDVVKMKIGDNCRLGDGSHLTAANYIEIGNNLLTGKKVLISDNSHGGFTKNELCQPPVVRKIVSKGAVKIGDNVWLGENVAVLSGVTIGHGSIIGANSVVTKDVPPYCIACGNPAKVVRQMDA